MNSYKFSLVPFESVNLLIGVYYKSVQESIINLLLIQYTSSSSICKLYLLWIL